ncbi:hypothetical protein OXIME_001658 [Oxyplasma meridianum]|uniref:DUF4013 domain-containing protein n=1 Tax=Oxyplasma meridianum TaxID=3073602 RepID=A0AAX4NHP1_9ARCH
MGMASTFNDDLYVIRESLKKLRTAFFVLFLGSILTIIPLIDIVGSLLLFIGVILLIMGFGRLADSKMVNARHYGSTRNWLIFNIIASLAVIVVSYYFLYVRVFSLIVSSLIVSGKPPSIPLSVLNESFLIAGASVAVITVIYVIAYLKIVASLKFLSAELSVPKLRGASTYLRVSIILFALTAVILFPSLYFGLHYLATLSSGNSSITYAGNSAFLPIGIILSAIPAAIAVPVIEIITALVVEIITALVIEIVAYHGAYSGLDEFFELADYKLGKRS